MTILAVIVLAGCSGIDNGTIGEPSELHIGMSPGQEEPEHRMQQLKPVEEYFTRELGINCRIHMTNGYSALIEGLRADKLEVAHLGPFGYIIASDKADAEVLVVRSKPGLGQYMYWSQIITHKNSGIDTWDEMVARADELVFQFNDPASTSGHLVPRGYLLSQGIVPEERFKQTIFGISHTATILTVQSRKVDVAACSGSSYTRMLENGMIAEEDFTILWKSAPIVAGPVATRKNLPEAFKNRLRDAYCGMKEKDPEAWRMIRMQWRDSTYEYVPGGPANDSLYNPLRDIAEHIDLVQLSNY